jgi:hypothetical protein
VETASYKSRIRVKIRIFIRLFFILTILLSSTLLLNQNKVYAATISPVELSNSPTADWRSIAMTEDGTKIVAGATSGIWVSSDSGASWTQRNSTSNINSVKLSSDGTKIYATYRGWASSQVLISNDFGLSWSTSRPTGYECWDACALDISSDGTKIYLINYGAGVYVSSNSGTSWTQTNSNRYNFTSVASSSSGQYVLISEESNRKLYLSSDYGQTWINLSAANSFNTNWVSVDISDDGQKLVATGYQNYVYTSSNGGTTWTTRTAVSGTQVRVASSSDGNVIVATNWGSNLRLTTDGGANWDSEPVNRYWFTPAINPSGTKAYMGIGESIGKIYSLTISSSPTAPTSLSATAGNGEATISFTAGSSGGSAITNYKYSLDGTTYTALSPTDAASPVTITGLTNGTSYSIYLKAVNANGDSSASASVSVTPSTTPSAPTSLTATAGDGQAAISFTAGSNGGSAITNYKYSIDGSTYTALSPSDASSPITISGLTNGTSYTVYLKAVNVNGDSSASSSVSVIPIQPSTYSFMDSTPGTNPGWAGGAGGGLELGISASTTSAISISAVRFYKVSGSTQSHTANIWNSSGTRIATQAFTSETSVGWQEVVLDSPISISSGSNFTVSVYSSNYYYPNQPFPTMTAGPVTIANGVYRYGSSSGFPNGIYGDANGGIGANYGVDFVFSTGDATAPSEPTSLVASAGNGSATISFTAGSNGGSAITNYKYSLDGTNFTELSPADSSTPVSIPGLTNGTSYTIYLKAVNSVGESAASSPVSVTPEELSGISGINWLAASGTTVVFNQNYVGALDSAFNPVSSWPNYIYNSPYSVTNQTYYAQSINCTNNWRWEQILCDPASKNNDLHYVTKSSQHSGFTVSNSSNREFYVVVDLGQSRTFNTFRVFQMFSDGKVTQASLFINSDSSSTRPSYNNSDWQLAGQGVVGQGLNQSSQVACPTAISLGTQTSRYVKLVFRNTGEYGNSSWLEVGAVKLFYETGLEAGPSPSVTCPSAPTHSLTPVWAPAATTPSAPTSLVATPANGQATISFTPGSNGGSAITNYKYSLDGTNYTTLSPIDASSPVTIPGLTNGTTYNIYLKAINSYGDSSASSAVSVTPATTPSAPTSLNSTAGDGQATISFTPGSNGGSAITNYKYSLDGTNYTALSPTDSSSPITISGLTNGTPYTVNLKAVNARGDSSASTSVSVTPSTTPSAPTSLTATAGDGQTTISFTPGSNGGSAITNYKYSTDGTTYTALSPADSSSPITISGLTNGTPYNIYLKAVNSAGEGNASSSVSVTPVAPTVSASDSSSPDNYFEPIRKIEVSNGKISWEPNKKVVISKYDPSSKKTTIIESTNGQLVLPKAKPGQSVSYSIMATDGTVLKKVTMKTKPNTPKIAKVASQKSQLLTINNKTAITAQWKKDKSVKKYNIKITLDSGKILAFTTTDPNINLVIDETKGATITITAIGKNNLTSTVTRKI